jgi:small subunit ribosomal protein S17
MAEKPKKQQKAKKEKAAGVLSTRGRTFEGYVIGKFPKRITIEFERTVFIQKYKRFLKKQTRIHARLPDNMDVNIGDLVQVRETRPLSKIIHFILTKVVRKAEEAK